MQNASVSPVFTTIDSPKALIGFPRILVTLPCARQSATALLNNTVVPWEEKIFLTEEKVDGMMRSKTEDQIYNLNNE